MGILLLLVLALILYILSTVIVIGGTYLEPSALKTKCYGIGGTMAGVAIVAASFANFLAK